MIKCFLKNSILDNDKTWSRPYKIKTGIVEVENAEAILSLISLQIPEEKAIRLVGTNSVDVNNLKAGDILKIYFGPSFKLIGEVEILTLKND